ncbi:MAG: sodium:proton antiporter [Chloracidobacterium sp. CP2_5A]|nr:MAG: sodium:proton antiporter [Chloracidobacterium sp. CP2_5A]
MSAYHTIAILLTLAALAAYINLRWIRLPTTIGLMAISLAMSAALLALGEMGLVPLRTFAAFVSSIDFGDVLLHGMLGFLLFAGALHVHVEDLRLAKYPVGILSTIGVALSTFVTGTLFFYATKLLGLPLTYLEALLFGALIAPTDPIAVLGIVKKVGAPKKLETKIAGESLFNDGVGVVVFLTLLGVYMQPASLSAAGVVKLFVQEAIGGAALGFIFAWAAYVMLKTVDAYQVEVLITLALVTGTYALAEALHLSAPIAIVVAGLFIGNRGRIKAMSDETRQRLDVFWELIDEILNAVLFFLIGLELIVIALQPSYFVIGLLAIVASLAGRAAGVGMTITTLRFKQWLPPGTIRILTWSGLRGGISIALALALPPSAARDILVAATYVVVVFSILVQGLTVGRLVAHFLAAQGAAPDDADAAPAGETA